MLEIFTKKNSLRNLRFHCGLFELEILEIFTTDFSYKNCYLSLNFFKYCRGLFTKTTKKKDASHLKIA